MAFIKENEHEFVMKNLEVYREFDAGNFISNAGSLLTNKAVPITVDCKFGFYSDMVDRMASELAGVYLNKEDIATLTNASTLLTDGKIEIVDMSKTSVTAIKPQYLSQMTYNVGVAIDKALNGTLLPSEENRYLSDAQTKVKQQLVKTNLPYHNGATELSRRDSAPLVPLTADYIKTVVVPFASSFEDRKKNLLIEAGNVSRVISDNIIDVEKYMNVIDSKLADGEISEKGAMKVRKVVYNAVRSELDVISYLSFMMIRKINDFMDRASICNSIYGKIASLSTTEESVFDTVICADDTASIAEDLTNGRTDYFDELSAKVYECNLGYAKNNVLNPLEHDEDDAMTVTVDNAAYLATAYTEASKMYIIISQGLDIIAANSDDYLMVFDDLVSKSGFTLALEDRFRSTLEILTDLSTYQDVPGAGNEENFVHMLKEVKDYSNNMDVLARNIFDCKEKMDGLVDLFNSNVNGEFSNSEAINEIKNFLVSLGEQYKGLTVKVAGAFMQRLKTLALLLDKEAYKLTHLEEDTPDAMTESVDFVSDALEEIQEAYKEETNCIMEQLMKEFYIGRKMKNEGVMVYEAEQPAQNTNNNQQSNTNNNNSSNNTQNSTNNQNQSGSAPKPKVNTGDGNDNSNNTNNNNNGDGTASAIKATLSKIGDFIRSKITQLTDMIKDAKGEGAKAKKFNEQKEQLKTRKYVNASVSDVLPYEKNMPYKKISSEMNKMRSNADRVKQRINTYKSTKEVYNDLFSGMGLRVKEGDDVGSIITNYYKVGNAPAEGVTIANGELDTFMKQGVIPYLEKYYNTGNGGLCDEIQKNFNPIIDVIDGANSEGTANEYTLIKVHGDDLVVLEASENNGNAFNPGQVASNALKLYCGGILNALRARANDYYNISSSFFKKVEATNDNNGNENNDNNNQEQNNQNNNNAQ